MRGSKKAVFIDATMKNAVLDEAQVDVNTQFGHADLTGASLRFLVVPPGAKPGPNFNATLPDGKHRTQLIGTHLENSDLRGAHFENADLLGAHLDGADLSGANFTGARVERMSDANARYCHTVWITGKERSENCEGAAWQPSSPAPDCALLAELK